MLIRRHAPPAIRRPTPHPWFWFGPRGIIGSGPLVGAGWDVAEAHGDLQLSVLVGGAAHAVSSAQADVECSVLLGGAAHGVATVAGTLGGTFVMTDLNSNATATSTAAGTLTVQGLKGAAQDQATATGALSSKTDIAGTAQDQATATGAPTVIVSVVGAAHDQASASATESTLTGLAGAAQDQTTATGVTTLEMAVSGAAHDQASATGTVAAVSGLSGAAADTTAASATISAGVNLSAAVQATGSATGTLAQAAQLTGAANVTTAAQGGLGVALTVTGGVTYAVNVQTGAVTTLQNFDFERLMTAHNRLYGLKGGTLYLIGGDTDPNATAIPASIRFAAQQFGTNKLKRLTDVYLNSRTPGTLTTTTLYDEVAGWQYTSAGNSDAGMVTHKVNVGKGNEFHSLGLIIANTAGGTLDIGGLELAVYPLSKRVP